jgi:hypothetical protein
VNAARTPKARKNAGRGGRRPAGRAGGAAGRPGGRPRETAPRDGVRYTGGRPVPFEHNRALAILGGLFFFTLGFAVAGVLVVGGLAVTAPYYVALVVGVVGLAVAGVAMSRGTTPMPESAIWTRSTLTLLSDAAALPAVAVMSVLYALAVIGVLGNVGHPLVFGVE